MGRSLFVSRQINASYAPTASNFMGLGGYDGLNDAGTEAYCQVVLPAAGTISNLSLLNTTGSVQVTTRINGVSGNGTVTSTGSLTTDGTHSDTISAGDKFGLLINSSSGSPNVTLVSAVYQSSGTHTAIYGAADAGAQSFAAGVTRYWGLARLNSGNSTEANYKCTIRAAGALSNLSVYIRSNATTASSTIRTRLNGANGGQTITIGSGLSGLFQDTTHSDTIASGDLANTQIINGGGGALSVGMLTVAFQNASSPQHDMFTSSLTTAFNTSATRYFALAGAMNGGWAASESDAQIQHGFPIRITRARVYISASSTAATVTAKIRINGADGNQSVSIGAGLTGLFEDTSNADVAHATDNANWSITTTGSANLTVPWAAVTVQDIPDLTGTSSVTLGALTSSATGALAIQATATPTLANLTLSGTGALALQAVATPTLANVTLAGTGALAIQATATPTLGALTLLSAGGATALVADAAITLGAATLSGAGVLALQAAATPTLANVTLSAAGTIPINGAAAVSLANATLSGAGVLAIAGTASATLAALTLASTGALAIKGVTSKTLSALTVVAVGTFPRLASATITLAALAITATGKRAFIGGSASVAVMVGGAASTAVLAGWAGKTSASGLTFTGKTSAGSA